MNRIFSLTLHTVDFSNTTPATKTACEDLASECDDERMTLCTMTHELRRKLDGFARAVANGRAAMVDGTANAYVELAQLAGRHQASIEALEVLVRIAAGRDAVRTYMQTAREACTKETDVG